MQRSSGLYTGSSFLYKILTENYDRHTLIKELALDCFEVGVTTGSLTLTALLRVHHLLVIHAGALLLIPSLGMPLHLLGRSCLHLHLRRSRTVMGLLMAALRKTSAASTAATSHISLARDRLRRHS